MSSGQSKENRQGSLSKSKEKVKRRESQFVFSHCYYKNNNTKGRSSLSMSLLPAVILFMECDHEKKGKER
jgi:hypothetical protein